MLRLDFDPEVLSRESVSLIADTYEQVLRSAVHHPASKLSELDCLSVAQRSKIIVGFNQTAVEYPRTCMPQLFEQQAERTPDNIAVLLGDQALTYRELNRQANWLAYKLKSLGGRTGADCCRLSGALPCHDGGDTGNSEGWRRIYPSGSRFTAGLHPCCRIAEHGFFSLQTRCEANCRKKSCQPWWLIFHTSWRRQAARR